VHTETGPDGDWSVRVVRSADKAYACPGCRQRVEPGTEHVVVWRNDDWFGHDAAIEDRRHWHSSCWAARGRRR
jgi:hypothetical protein